MMPLRISEKHNAIVIPFDHRVTSTVPHAKVLTRNGKRYHILPHKPSEVKLLSNLGYGAPAPILTQYDWCGTTPFEHQKVTAAMASTEMRFYILNGLGSGKTRSALYAADFLMRKGEVKRALIIAPLSTLSTTWEHEIFKVMPHRQTAVVHGSRDKRKLALQEDVDFYIVNTDGVHIIEEWLRPRKDIDLVIVDELANFRNSRTRRWKAANKIISPRPRAWGMTGLVTPNGPTDAYAQGKLITPARVPKYFKAFQTTVEYQITPFLWKPRKEANDIISNMLRPAVRFATEDCIDLPPTTFSTRYSDMSKDQEKAYKSLVTLFYTMYQGQEINAANAGVKTAKLLQVAAGFAYTEGEGVVTFPDNNKIKLLREIIKETNHKIIVFAPFRHAVDLIFKDLGKDYSVAKVYGGVSKSVRDHIFSEFRQPSGPRIIAAHPAAMSHGITLTEADTIVWYSPTTSYETYEQANARIVRPGQVNHTHIINLESCAIEKKMYTTLANKGNTSNVLLDMFAELTSKRKGG